MEESYAPYKSSSPASGPITATPGSPNATAPVNNSVKVPTGWTRLPEHPPQSLHQMAPPPHVTPQTPRPELSRQHWQMSPADCTQGLGMDLYGTDVATMMDAGWQVSSWFLRKLPTIKPLNRPHFC